MGQILHAAQMGIQRIGHHAAFIDGHHEGDIFAEGLPHQGPQQIADAKGYGHHDEHNGHLLPDLPRIFRRAESMENRHRQDDLGHQKFELADPLIAENARPAQDIPQRHDQQHRQKNLDNRRHKKQLPPT